MGEVHLRQILLWAVIAILCLVALVVIVAILGGGEINDDAGRLLLACLLFGVFGAASLPAASLMEKDDARWLAVASITLCVCALGLGVITIWGDLDDEGVYTSAGVVSVWALAVSDACFVVTRRAATDSWLAKCLMLATLILAAAIALILTPAITGETEDEDGFYRSLAVVFVLWSLTTVLLPIVRLAQRNTSARR